MKYEQRMKFIPRMNLTGSRLLVLYQFSQFFQMFSLRDKVFISVSILHAATVVTAVCIDIAKHGYCSTVLL